MTPEVGPVPRPEWTPVPREGTRGVEGKVLLRESGLFLALLRFAPASTIDEHPAPHPITVVCLEGEGLTSVGGETAPLHAGERVVWPAGVPHRLWTEASTMTTLMVERPGTA